MLHKLLPVHKAKEKGVFNSSSLSELLKQLLGWGGGRGRCLPDIGSYKAQKKDIE